MDLYNKTTQYGTVRYLQQKWIEGMKTIVITSDKGGVGKSTLAALIIEWLNFNNILVDLVDADPIQTTRT